MCLAFSPGSSVVVKVMAKVSEKPALKSQSAQKVLGTFLTGPQMFSPLFLHTLFLRWVLAGHS